MNFPTHNTSTSVLMTEIVLPSHTNALGTIFGGVIMGWVDIAGAIACQRYARSSVVTVSVDYLHFIVPIKTGYSVQIHADVTWAGKTSMEVEAIVLAENSIEGTVEKATQAYLTFVAVNAQGKPQAVPPFVATTDEQKAKLKQAEARRARRLQFKQS